jgi:hypothetical protein
MLNVRRATYAKCEACHIIGGGGFTVPEKKDGDLLICQLCHARGNYIAIHIDGNILEGAEIDAKWIRKRPGLECTACHNEDLYDGKSILDLHEEAVIRVEATKREEIVEMSPETRKRIAEWGSPAAPTTVVRID